MIKTRNPKKVAFLTVVTLGVYFLVWLNQVRNEINEDTEKVIIPTMWLFLVPLMQYYWMWIFCEALEGRSEGKFKLGRNDTFLLYILVGAPHMLIFQLGPDTGGYIIVAAFYAFLAIIGLGLLSVFPMVLQKRINQLAADS